MPKHRAALIALCAAAMLLGLLPAGASAAEPWWQVLTSTRPSNLWAPHDPSEVQEVTTRKVSTIFVARVEVGGAVVGCIGTGSLGVRSADAFCEEETGFPAAEDAAEFQAILEGPYGAGEVEVSGGPAGGAAFEVTTAWGAVPLQLTPILFNGVSPLGIADADVVSEGSGTLALTLTNLGDAPVDGASEPVTITDRLPAGLVAYGFFDPAAGGQGQAGPVLCELQSAQLVSCSFESELPSYEGIEIDVLVAATGSPPTALAPGTVTVTGGGAQAMSVAQPIEVSPAPVPFGIENFTAKAEEEGGGETRQAGVHPFQWTNTIQWRSGRLLGKNHPFPQNRREALIEQPALPRNSGVTFPAGFAGKVNAVPTCELGVFLQRNEQFKNDCPDSSVVGVASATVIESQNFGFLRVAVPIFNLPPARGEPARFGFMPAGVPVLIETSVDPDDEYRITGEVRNAPQIAQVISATISIWGVPGDPRHDSARGWGCAYFASKPSECPSTAEQDRSRSLTPFLRMPVSCASPLGYAVALEPWNVPAGSFVDRAPLSTPPLQGCNKEPFDPSISSALTSKAAESPSGLDFRLDMPNEGLENPQGIAETQFKKAEVTLPEGVTVNPSEAEGLATCSPADYRRERYDSAPGEGCPEASKIGSVKISTPLLEEEAEGALYIAAPYDNPFDSLIALYLVAKIPARGILVKQAGVVRPDPRTGRLVTTFDDVPQLPVSSFKLHFREGARAPLVTPPACGSYDTVARFMPWSAQNPENPAADELVGRTSSLQVERGNDGGACPSGGTPPFHPGLEAGTLNNAAGHYSPFNLRLSRTDAEQEITHFSLKLPPGVTGKLAGIPFCPDADIAAAKAREGTRHGGAEELERPSCPQASQIGTTLAGAGVGQVLTWVGGKVYLAGPYHGSNLSIVAITAAKAGPFDLGTVVIREALKVDPETAEVSVDAAGSDPLPHIIAGIPVHLREIRVSVDRPEFVLNPTSCEPTSVASTVLGSGTDFASEADDRPVTVTTRFQAADCASLQFRPKVRLTLKGATRRAGLPKLKAVVLPRKGDANIGRAVVTLPKSEFLEQGHIKTVCTRVQFNAGGGNGEQCPRRSVYGHAKAWTPLLSEPLEGPVFLRSNGGERRLPDLVAALHSRDIDIDLLGFIKSLHPKGSNVSRIRTIFASVPDAPVSRFRLEMFGGKRGLLINSTNLCKGKHRAISIFVGQNGRRSETRPAVHARCKKRHKKHAGHKKTKAAKKKGSARVLAAFRHRVAW